MTTPEYLYTGLVEQYAAEVGIHPADVGRMLSGDDASRGEVLEKWSDDRAPCNIPADLPVVGELSQIARGEPPNVGMVDVKRAKVLFLGDSGVEVHGPYGFYDCEDIWHTLGWSNVVVEPRTGGAAPSGLDCCRRTSTIMRTS